MIRPISAREAILARIRGALSGEPTSVESSRASIARAYNRTATLDRQACLELFTDRLVDYDAEVIELDRDTLIAHSVSEVLQKSGEERLIVGEGFPQPWLPTGVDVTVDYQFSTAEINEHAQAVLTTCEAAAALTGTICLIHGGAQCRRVTTLLPDHHICLVRRDQVYETVPEALAAIASGSKRPITLISGPSATADIEMTRIRGVHGPRRLTIILYGEP